VSGNNEKSQNTKNAANVYLPFANVQYAAYVFVILWLPGDGYNA
jgi:hypothetical protein